MDFLRCNTARDVDDRTPTSSKIPLALSFIHGDCNRVGQVQTADFLANRNPQCPLRLLLEQYCRQSIRLAAENKDIASFEGHSRINPRCRFREIPNSSVRETIR